MAGNIWFFQFEADFIVWLQQLGSGTFFQTILNALNQFFSFLGEEYICIAVLGSLYWGLDKKKGERLGYIFMLSGATNTVLKNIFRRLRPFWCDSRIKLLREVGNYSFPSGHSSNAGSLYPTVAYEYRKKNWKWLTAIAIIVPILVAVSRNYVGAHWPTDVVCGLLLGVLCFLFGEFVVPKFKNKYLIYFITFAVCAIGFTYCTTDDYFTNMGMFLGLILGLLFEEKYVKFKNTKVWYRIVIRVVIGGALYFALNALIKLAFGWMFEEGTYMDFIFRFLRYTAIIFIDIGIYPLTFKLVGDKIFKK